MGQACRACTRKFLPGTPGWCSGVAHSGKCRLRTTARLCLICCYFYHLTLSYALCLLYEIRAYTGAERLHVGPCMTHDAICICCFPSAAAPCEPMQRTNSQCCAIRSSRRFRPYLSSSSLVARFKRLVTLLTAAIQATRQCTGGARVESVPQTVPHAEHMTSSFLWLISI